MCKTCAKHDRGFTLIELLVVIAIIAVLLSLSLPIFGAVRHRLHETKCFTAIRSCAQAVHLYGNDYQDQLPFGGPNLRQVSFGDVAPVRMGGRLGLLGGAWAMLFPEYWRGPSWDRSMQCSRQPEFVGAPAAFTRGGNPRPAYDISGAVWLTAGDLRAGLAYEAARPRQNMLADVVFPSKKVLFYEGIGYCARGPDVETWVHTIGQTFPFETTNVTFDGAVRRMKQIDGLPSPTTMPFNRTLHGLQGRDLP